MATTPQILTGEQRRVLHLFSRVPSLTSRFYFTGGTPLAAFYMHHRYSEDIDLFSETEVNLLALRAFIGKMQKTLRLVKIDYRNFYGLHTFQLFFTRTNVLKIDFNYYPFPRIEKGIKYENIVVDSVLDIAVNKVHTIALKPRARDFVDIYFIIKQYKFSFADLLKKAKAKFDWHIDPVQLGSRLLEAKELMDYPRMIKKIDHNEWKDFFVAEAQKLKKEIFK